MACLALLVIGPSLRTAKAGPITRFSEPPAQPGKLQHPQDPGRGHLPWFRPYKADPSTYTPMTVYMLRLDPDSIRRRCNALQQQSTVVKKPPPTTTVASSKHLKIVTQNVAGLASKENKVHKISNILVRESIDVMILTEVKKWKLKWTQFFEPMGYKVIDSTKKDQVRGGVVSLIKLEHTQARILYSRGSTFHIYKLKYQDPSATTQKLLIVATYINP